MRKLKELKQVPQNRSISSDIVDYLHREGGMNLKEIGDLMRLSQAFVSRVWRGKRVLKISQLLELEDAFKQPLFLLIIAATKKSSLSGKIRRLYFSHQRLLKQSGHLDDLLISIRKAKQRLKEK